METNPREFDLHVAASAASGCLSKEKKKCIKCSHQKIISNAVGLELFLNHHVGCNSERREAKAFQQRDVKPCFPEFCYCSLVLMMLMKRMTVMMMMMILKID